MAAIEGDLYGSVGLGRPSSKALSVARALYAHLPVATVGVLTVVTLGVLVALPARLVEMTDGVPFGLVFAYTFAFGSFVAVFDQMLRRAYAWRNRDRQTT